MTAASLHLPVATIEGLNLARLVAEFREMLVAQITDDRADPALTRLAPDPYPEDAEASRAFAEATRDDLFDRRAADAAVVSASLADFESDAADDALAPRQLVIPLSDVDAWLRTLTAVRLVLANRLGIVRDDDLGDDDPRRGVYDWLGYRLELLIQAADAAE